MIILSPAKSMDMSITSPLPQGTVPRFQKEAEYIASQIQDYSRDQLQTLLQISNKLTDINYERYQEFDRENSRPNTRLPWHAIRRETREMFSSIYVRKPSPRKIFNMLRNTFGSFPPYTVCCVPSILSKLIASLLKSKSGECKNPISTNTGVPSLQSL